MLWTEVLQHKGVRMVALGWSSFIAENVIVTSNRDMIIAWLGDEKSYATCYGTMSTACLTATGIAYARHARVAGPVMFIGALPPGRAAMAWVLQSLGFVGLSQLAPPLAGRATAMNEVIPEATTSSSSSAALVPPSATVEKTYPISSADGAKPPASGCPLPGWMRAGRAMPKDHQSQAEQHAARTQHTTESSSSPDAPPAADGCPMPRWATFGLGRGSSKASEDSKKIAKVEEPPPPPPAPEPQPVELAVGVERVTRHVSFWCLGLAGLGSAVAARHAGCLAMFSGPAAVAAIGGAHQDHRYRRSGQLSPERDAVTSGVPFVALLTGRQSWEALLAEIDRTNAAAAVAVAVTLALRRSLF